MAFRMWNSALHVPIEAKQVDAGQVHPGQVDPEQVDPG